MSALALSVPDRKVVVLIDYRYAYQRLETFLERHTSQHGDEDYESFFQSMLQSYLVKKENIDERFDLWDIVDENSNDHIPDYTRSAEEVGLIFDVIDETTRRHIPKYTALNCGQGIASVWAYDKTTVALEVEPMLR